MVIINSMEKYGHLIAMAAAEEKLKKCGVFDLKGCTYGLMERVVKKGSPCPLLVFLYACFGIHRYNLLKGTKFEVKRVKKYIKSTKSAARSYYITLDAKDGSSPSSSPLETFQTKVSETSVGKFLLSCTIARIRGDTSNDTETTWVYIPGKKAYLLGKHLPEWPQENPFEKPSLVKKESELEENDKDWIHLYMELAVAMTGCERDKRKPKDYQDLEILDLAVDEELSSRNATLYIRFKDLFRAEIGRSDDVDRLVVVRRRFDEDTGLFSVEGQILSSELVIPKKRGLVANEEEDIGCSTSQS